MKKTRTLVILAALATAAGAATVLIANGAVSAHCQMPCGIYDDATRFALLEEDVATIEKSMNQIRDLSTAEGDPEHANQIARWVMTKEDHAGLFTDVVVQYFLQQRVKAVAPDAGHDYEHYVQKLTLCHEMLVTVMKCKQTVDLANVEKLRTLLADFKKAYSE